MPYLPQRGDGYEINTLEHPPVRIVIGTIDAVLAQVQAGAGAYILLGCGHQRRCYIGRSVNQPLPLRVRASVYERRAVLGGVDGVITLQGAIPRMPWDECRAALHERYLLATLPQAVVNQRRAGGPLRHTLEQANAAHAAARFVEVLLRSRSYPRQDLTLDDALLGVEDVAA